MKIIQITHANRQKFTYNQEPKKRKDVQEIGHRQGEDSIPYVGPVHEAAIEQELVLAFVRLPHSCACLILYL